MLDCFIETSQVESLRHASVIVTEFTGINIPFMPRGYLIKLVRYVNSSFVLTPPVSTRINDFLDNPFLNRRSFSILYTTHESNRITRNFPLMLGDSQLTKKFFPACPISLFLFDQTNVISISPGNVFTGKLNF